jgi:hypothetical protein
MAYDAGKHTSVRTVPAKVPPIKVYASVLQNTDWVSGTNASMAASAVRNDRTRALHSGLDHRVERRQSTSFSLLRI